MVLDRNKTTTLPNTQQISSNYANVGKQTNNNHILHPTKEQAIVITAINKIPLKII